MSNNNNETNQVPARDPRLIEDDVRQPEDKFSDCFWVIAYRYSWYRPDEINTAYGKYSSQEAALRAISRAIRDGEYTTKDQVWACKVVL